MRIRTLGEQLTFYDEEGNILMQIPNDPPDFSEENCKVFNILEYEERLMGVDPDAKPDFFIDLNEVEDFIREHARITDRAKHKFFFVDSVIIMMIFAALFFGAGVLGHMAGGDLLDILMNSK